MTAPAPTAAELSRKAREQFITHAQGVMVPLCDAIRNRMIELVDASPSTRQMQDRRDAMLEFERLGKVWATHSPAAWRAALVAPTDSGRQQIDSGDLELIGDEVVEKKILSSRLALAILDKASWELKDLKIRISYLDGDEQLASHDVLRPEVVAQVLVEQWEKVGMPRDAWLLVQDVVHQHVVSHFVASYRHVNDFLVHHGVLPDVEAAAKVKRVKAAPPPRKGVGGGGSQAGQSADGSGSSGDGGGGRGWGNGGAGGGGGGGGGGPNGGGEYASSRQDRGASGVQSDYRGAGGGSRHSGHMDETRMMTGSTPLARARMRASGMLGQLKRMLTDKVAGYDPDHATRPSPALAEAMQHDVSAQVFDATVYEVDVIDDRGVERVAVAMRERTGELKKKATTSNEKATIEIVALMFQSILAEERIPPTVRVWFARLQMPVLRVALAEPEFFGTLQHPARQLIDRMGSCVLGFDAATIHGSALEVEIKRVVQVIEQYPETGRRVYQLVFDEFQKFLSKFLTEKGDTQRLVSVAQQVEQKETMAVKYTIELRNMLKDLPVRDELRQFLFKVWAEVLAVAAVKNGAQHEETLMLKKAAADLVWASSAKPNRADRARVIQDLPALLQRLRMGMSLMGLRGNVQEDHIKIIGDTLADAFQSKTETVPQARIDAMAKRLANLEDFITDEQAGDLPLDANSIELMLGIDASTIEVVADGGSKPTAAMMAWAQELQPGNWFTLDHNSRVQSVQYAWASERKQLHLFASTDGHSVLIQLRRLAAYLQAGLLVPSEDEALTVRATRDALAKLDANPERLLN